MDRSANHLDSGRFGSGPVPSFENIEPRLMLAGDMVISEFMAINDSTVADEDGDYSDWIELHNRGDAAVDLDGWYLTDDAADPGKWRIPPITLDAGDFEVIFASDKDRDDPDEELHTSFKLSGPGEYLALVMPDGTSIVHAYPPAVQYADISYGLDLDGNPVYFDEPTPGAANDGWTYQLADVAFSVPHGIVDAPFALELSNPDPDATLYYTLDGTDPTASGDAIEYTGPIAIDATTVVRAYAQSGQATSVVATQTYISLASVLTQSNDQTAIGFPDIWHAGAGGSGIYDSEYRDADYEMDPDIVNHPVWGPRLTEALTQIPSMSLTLDPADLWDPYDGIYPNSIQRASRSEKWEKPSSLELFYPDGSDEGFSVNAGARMFGELARWAAVNDKQSFRMVFQGQYGPTKLVTDFFGDPDVDRYDTIVLRAHWGKSWLLDEVLGDKLGASWLNSDPSSAQYVRDLYALQTFADTGNLSSDGRFVHLYLNGLYWGLFEVIERSDNSFNAEHRGGDKDDYSVIKGSAGWRWYNHQKVQYRDTNGRLQDGSRAMWDWLFDTYFDAGSDGINTSSRSAISDQDLDEIAHYVDLDNFIDYMITLWTLNRGDFPGKNWYAGWEGGAPGTPPVKPVQFYVWDSEASLAETEITQWTSPVDRWNAPTSRNDTGPVRMYWRLITNERFRLRWMDRAYELLGDGGALSDEASMQRYADLAGQIDMAVIAESARWGDSATLHVDDPMTQDDWLAEYDRLMTEWFPGRAQTVLDQMASVGLADAPPAPAVGPRGGGVGSGTHVTFYSASGDDEVWYTLDGTDPLDGGGTLMTMSEGVSGPVVGEGSEWVFNDTGTDLGTAWREVDYDVGEASDWETGSGHFGYGNGDEDTVVEFGDNSLDKHITTYFRNENVVLGYAPQTPVTLRVRRDDGVVIYINGQEAVRSNMPDGEITYDTRADSSVAFGAENQWHTFDVDPALFQAGVNVIAAEVHKYSPQGWDLSFELTVDLEAGGVGTAPVEIFTDTHVVARTKRDGKWGYKTEAVYVIDEAPALEITEVNYNPPAATPAEREAGVTYAQDFEFIEIHNPTGNPVRQIGATLGGGIAATLPLFELGPDEYGVFVRDREAFQLRYGTDVKILGEYDGRLANEGERVVLTSSNGTVLADFTYDDAANWPGRADGRGATLEVIDTQGDYNDDDTWRSSTEYLGTPGAAGVGPIDSVIVNEVVTTLPGGFDAVELHNPTDAPIGVGGWYLSDTADEFTRFRIPDGTVIPAGGYRVYTEITLGFGLSRWGEDVWLMAADNGALTHFVDHAEFGAALPGMPFGRYPGEDGDSDITALASITLGGPNAGPFMSEVVLSEVHYHPGDLAGSAEADLEFLELYNRTDRPLPLDWYDANGNGVRDANEQGAWRLAGAVDFTFPAGTTIAPGGTLVVVGAASVDAFRTAYGVDPGVTVLGAWEGRLANNRERVELRLPAALRAGDTEPAYVVADKVDYKDHLPWPASADGAGDSLHRLSAWAYGNLAVNWFAAEPSPGQTALTPAGLEGDFNHDARVDAIDIDLINQAVRAGTGDQQFDLDGDGDADGGDVTYLLNTILGTHAGDFNLDGYVDLDDFDIIKAGFGRSAGWAGGDATGDGVVDLEDFVAFKKNYGAQPIQQVEPDNLLAPLDVLSQLAAGPIG
ncbi:MAG: lamin tail domain-containing protein [Planctomycetota bacterium]